MAWSIDNVLCGDTFMGYVFKSAGGTSQAEFCAALQQKAVAAAINVPGMPYVSIQSYEDILKSADKYGYVSAGPDKGSKQCAALVKAAIPALGATSNWRKAGDLDSHNISTLTTGTAIGYGFDAQGRYPSNPHGNHVAIFISADNGDVKILDQWYHGAKFQKAAVHSTDLSTHDWAILTRVK